MDQQIIEDEESLLGDILEKHLDLHTNIIHRANFFIAAFTFILGVSMLKILDNSFLELNFYFQYAIFIMGAAPLISLFIIIFVMVPKVQKKQYKGTNLFYYAGFLQKYTREEYTKEIKKRLQNPKSIIDTYSEDIYELGRHVLLPAYKKIRLASQIFLSGLFVSFILIVLGLVL